MRLNSEYYQNDDVVFLAENLLGKKICTCIDGVLTSAMIVETEAYAGIGDKACHAHLGRFTNRTATMYEQGGIAYIYLCYGIHHLFNIVTNVKGNADAVLIRAVEPVEGLEHMKGRASNKNRITAGPGKLSKALGITKAYNGINLVSSENIWLEDFKMIDKDAIYRTTRIGIDYAGEDALLPWRFYIKRNNYVSKY